MVVNVEVIYCGGWGYAPKFQTLKGQLTDEFGEMVKVTGIETKETSGWLEVKVGNVLVHSKKGGDGYIDSEAKLQKIVKAIENQLDQ